MLSAVLKNQPAVTSEPLGFDPLRIEIGSLQKFKEVLTSIGGKFFEVDDLDRLKNKFNALFSEDMRKITMIPELSAIADVNWMNNPPHSFEDVDVAVLNAHFAVAENGALWLTEKLMGQRIIPFICQELVVILKKENVLATMHDAYAEISDQSYGFGVFIAGPSKTADIEQSLVLGAHGAKGLTVFLIS